MSLVPVWCVAPLEMNEGTHLGGKSTISLRLQCRKGLTKRLLNLFLKNAVAERYKHKLTDSVHFYNIVPDVTGTERAALKYSMRTSTI